MKIAGALAAVLFVFVGVASAQNLLTNPSFNTNLSGWTLDGPGWSWDSTLNVTPTPGSGSAKNLGAGTMSQCVGGIVTGASYSWGGKVYIPTGQGNVDSGNISLVTYSSTDCSGTHPDLIPVLQTYQTGMWVTLGSPAGGHFDPSVNSVKLVAEHVGGGVPDHQVNFDDLYFSGFADPIPILGRSTLIALAVILAAIGLLALRRVCG